MESPEYITRADRETTMSWSAAPPGSITFPLSCQLLPDMARYNVDFCGPAASAHYPSCC